MGLSDLINIVEYTFEKMMKTSRFKHVYIYVSYVLPIYFALLIFAPLDNLLFKSTALLIGFIGSTIHASYIVYVLYHLDNHLDLSKYYYLNIRDVTKITREDLKIEKLSRSVTNLLLVSKIGVEYSPVILIPAYTSLLLLHDKVYSLIFFTLYICITALITREIVLTFNKHVECEKLIEQSLHEIYGYEPSMYMSVRYHNIYWFVLMIMSLTVISTYVIVELIKNFEQHLYTHRNNHVLVKNALIKQLNLNQ